MLPSTRREFLSGSVAAAAAATVAISGKTAHAEDAKASPASWFRPSYGPRSMRD